MEEREFYMTLGRLSRQEPQFCDTINTMLNLLDDGDQEDFFGTEGWKHQVFND